MHVWLWWTVVRWLDFEPEESPGARPNPDSGGRRRVAVRATWFPLDRVMDICLSDSWGFWKALCLPQRLAKILQLSRMCGFGAAFSWKGSE